MIKIKRLCGEVLNTRFFGKNLREEIISALSNKSEVVIDFEDVSSMSQSFADESFGKLAENIGLEDFKTKLKIINVKSEIAKLIKYVVMQRIKNKKEEEDEVAVWD